MAASAGLSSEGKFRFSALAQLLAGELDAPFQESPTSNACVLPATGGYQHLFWSDFNFARFLHIEGGYAETLGRFDDEQKAWQTTARIVLENVNLGEVVTIGRMSATLASSYPVTLDPPSFAVFNAVFDDVRVAGIPVQITIDLDTWSRFFTRETVKSGSASWTQTGNGAAITSIVPSVTLEPGRFSDVHPEGNKIAVPDFGRIRLGELSIEPEHCVLKLLSAELEGPMRGRFDLGVLSIDGVPDRPTQEKAPAEPAPVQEEWAPDSTNLDEEEEAEVLDDLNQWVNTHPHKDEPFLFFMGHSLTPVEFFREVEEHTGFGRFFLRLMSDQSKRFGEHPRDAIRRAIDANRHQ